LVAIRIDSIEDLQSSLRPFFARQLAVTVAIVPPDNLVKRRLGLRRLKKRRRQ
jgi:hypothetical protein